MIKLINLIFNKELISIFLFFILMYLGVILFKDFIFDWLIRIKGFSELSKLNIFIIFFYFQEIFFLICLIVSLFFYIGYVNIKKYIYFFAKQFVWIGFFNNFKIISYYFVVYILIILIINFISLYFNIDVPGFGGEQSAKQLVSTFIFNGFLDYLLVFTMIVIVGPIVEELIFRGFIANLLFIRYGFWISLIFSSIIFSTIHLDFGVFINLLVLSFLINYIYLKHKSLLSSLFFHIFVNFLGFIGIIMKFGIIYFF